MSQTPPGMRIYAIGDVHGCDAMLVAVHGKIAADLAGRPVADHRIIHIGDYADRGPDSAKVIARLAALTVADSRVICLRGNHDQMLLDFLADPETAPDFLGNGGKETLRSYGVGRRSKNYADLAREFAGLMPAADRAFLEALPRTVQYGDYLFVHAGVRPGVPLAAQEPQDLMWIRDDFLNDPRDHGVVVIHGHTYGPAPDLKPNRINIDSGAVFGGPLTCLMLEGTEYRFL